jgi:TolB protein
VGCLHARDEEQQESAKPPAIPNQLRQEKIAFSSRRDGDFEIFVSSSDGSDVRQLTTNVSPGTFYPNDESPAFSPDGRLIAFTRTQPRRDDPAATTRELYVMNADGSRERRLTQNAADEFDPDWLPDGRIVFISCTFREGEDPDCRLTAIRPDRTEQEELAEVGFAYELAASPEGERVAYSEVEGQSHFQHAELHVMDIDGGGHRQLTDNEAGDGSPAWSPGGERIAFVSNRAASAPCFSHDCAGFTTELYVMDEDGSDVTRLTKTPHQESSPAWSPDGTKILYSRQLDAQDKYALYIVNADGTCPTRLIPGAWDVMPDWYGPAGSKSRPRDC